MLKRYVPDQIMITNLEGGANGVAWVSVNRHVLSCLAVIQAKVNSQDLDVVYLIPRNYLIVYPKKC